MVHIHTVSSSLIHLFIYGICNGAVNSPDYVVSKDRTVVNKALEAMWNEVVVA
jgi:hypothetical protein